MLEPLPDRYRAVVFDMDGLLLDTETLWTHAEEELFRRHGAEFTFDDKLAVMGTTEDFTARYYAERLGRPLAQGYELFEEMRKIMISLLQLQVQGRPGAIELVARLRGRVALALASNSGREVVGTSLDTARLAEASAASPRLLDAVTATHPARRQLAQPA